MNVIKTRGILSSLLILSFLVVAFTGIGLYFVPSGRIAWETGWSFFGLEKSQLENLHTITGFLMAALILVHLSINRHMFYSELMAVRK